MSSQKFIILILLLTAGSTFAQYPNIRLHPSDTNQIEPSITVHPSNPQILFASAFTIKIPHQGEGVYVTTNGGQSWYGIDKILEGSPTPTTHGGDPGPVIDKDGRFILTHRGRELGGWWSNYSNDNGLSWSNSVPIFTGAADQDKGIAGTDDVSSSAYYGRTYQAWTRLTAPYPIVMSITTNGGQSWSAFVQINSTPSGHFSVGPSIAIGIAGQVYVSWAAAIISSPQSENLIGFAISSNGGANWTVWENAYDCNGIKTSQLTPWTIRANGYPMIDVDRTGGSRNGWIYIVTGEKNLAPAGSDPDIVFHRSTNGGVNWSQGIRVNQDPLNNGKIQFFPAINADDDGGINVVYYDNRNGTDSVEVFISRSTDGGNTWTDYIISDHKFRPAPVTGAGGGNMGDNIGITSSNGKLYPVWMDNKVIPGILQVLTAIIDYNTIGIEKISSEIPAKFDLKQNYPNPFNPTTTIEYDVSNVGFVTIKVYDYTGRLVRTLAKSRHETGTHRVIFDGLNLSSGVYFYSLETGDGFAQTKKMILVK